MKPLSLITGTGSSGTTFLVGLCAELDLCRVDHLYVNQNIGGGYETEARQVVHSDLVYKNPRLFFGGLAEEFHRCLDRGRKLDYIFVCHRDYTQASMSRIARGVVFDKWETLRGYGTTAQEKQIDFFRKGMELTITTSLHLGMEIVFVDYESLHSPQYCFKVLSRRFPQLTEEEVFEAHKKLYKPAMKHSY